MNFKEWLLSESMTRSDALEVLELEPNFTEEQLKNAFREKSRLYHTDKGGDLQSSINVNTAYDILKKSLKKDTDISHERISKLTKASPSKRSRWGLNPYTNGMFDPKKHSIEELDKAEKEYSQSIKKNKDASKPIENISTVQKEAKTILNKIHDANIIAAIMIFKTEKSLIDNYLTDDLNEPTDMLSNYEIQDKQDQNKLEKYKNKLKKLSKDKLRNILFDVLVNKFVNKQQNLINTIAGIIPMKDALKPWRQLISFLKKFDLRLSHPSYVDWRKSTLSNIVKASFDY